MKMTRLAWWAWSLSWWGLLACTADPVQPAPLAADTVVAPTPDEGAIDGREETQSPPDTLEADTQSPAPPPASTVDLPPTTGRIPADFAGGHNCWPWVSTAEGGDWADTLAETGCYLLGGDSPEVVAEAIAYDVRVPLWADLAGKTRYLFLPEGAQLGWNATTSFDFPDGTVLLKEFFLDGALVESRFVLKAAGTWEAATYRWNATFSDATVVRLSETLKIGEHDWLLPGIEDCTLCHTNSADFVLGLRGDQLFREVDMFGLGEVNQVAALNDLGLFKPPLPATIELSPLARIDDSEATVTERARSYMASNCANCHRPGGAPHSDIDLRIGTPLSEMRACDVFPLNTVLGLGALARIIVPGEPDRSLLSLRMERRDDEAMPQLGTFVVHEAGAVLIRAWIEGLAACE